MKPCFCKYPYWFINLFNSKKMKKYRVFIDGIPSEIEESDFEKYNVIQVKGNGYSHVFTVIEKFDKAKHFTKEYCSIFKKEFSYSPTHLTTEPVNGFVGGSSSVSFS